MAEEYIEKSFAIEAIKSLYPNMPRIDFCGSLRKWHEDNKNFMQCEMAIEVIPAADVAPVRHGRWIEESDYDGDSIYVCSECGETWTLIDGTPQDNNMHYCPNCGAKMDGGKNV